MYIILLLIFAPALLSAKIITPRHDPAKGHALEYFLVEKDMVTDTTKKHQQEEERNRIKEISLAKRQAKPEKIDDGGNPPEPGVKAKPKRERRPEGLERPPEIPRRDGN